MMKARDIMLHIYSTNNKDVIFMKKKLLAVILVVAIIISVAGVWYYTSYPIIGVGIMRGSNSDKFENEFYSEAISIVSAGSSWLPDSPLQKRKMDEVWMWNNTISHELLEHRKEGGLAYNIKVSGEIEDGKTTLRYEGYIIKNDGKRIDYKEEKTFDFILCAEKRFFTDKM